MRLRKCQVSGQPAHRPAGGQERLASSTGWGSARGTRLAAAHRALLLSCHHLTPFCPAVACAQLRRPCCCSQAEDPQASGPRPAERRQHHSHAGSKVDAASDCSRQRGTFSEQQPAAWCAQRCHFMAGVAAPNAHGRTPCQRQHAAVEGSCFCLRPHTTSVIACSRRWG